MDEAVSGHSYAKAAIEMALYDLQGKIAGEMRIKRTPTLTFHYDESVDRGARISRLLDE